jgi:hypothetical protein
MLFATGCRTVTTWLRAAGVCTDYKAYYYFLGSVGRNTQRIADQLLCGIFRRASLDERSQGHVLFAIDDSLPGNNPLHNHSFCSGLPN